MRPGSDKVARAKEIAATASGPWSATIRPIRWPISWNASLRPGVAEEAWRESLVCPLLYWALQRYARAGAAILAAAILGTLWFAFLHVPLNALVMVLLASILVLPMTFLWLRRAWRCDWVPFLCRPGAFLGGLPFLPGSWFS